MAEHSAVNRRVVGSSPTCGANLTEATSPVAFCFIGDGSFKSQVMFWVYVLENPRGKFYVGQTANLAERVIDHNRTDAFDGHYTRKNGPWTLVWSESHESRSSAMRREGQIKRMKSAAWIRTNLLQTVMAAVNPDESGL